MKTKLTISPKLPHAVTYGADLMVGEIASGFSLERGRRDMDERDDRIERAQWKLNVVRWALTGMVEEGQEPEKVDLDNLLHMVTLINLELDQAIKEPSGGVGKGGRHG